MLDAEKLLGKVLSSAMQSGGKKRKKSKKRKKKQMFDSIGSQLMSGKGLMTMIGLGVGAYEILKSKQTSSPQAYGRQLPRAANPVPVPPPLTPGATTPVPPPLPAAKNNQEAAQQPTFPGGGQALAMRLIQVMVAAAYADGRMDELEEEQILGRMQEQGLSGEEKRYILAELHSPKEIDELTADLSTPQLAQTAYTLAVSTVVVDSEREREWLDRLAGALAISTAMQEFIEEQLIE